MRSTFPYKLILAVIAVFGLAGCGLNPNAAAKIGGVTVSFPQIEQDVSSYLTDDPLFTQLEEMGVLDKDQAKLMLKPQVTSMALSQELLGQIMKQLDIDPVTDKEIDELYTSELEKLGGEAAFIKQVVDQAVATGQTGQISVAFVKQGPLKNALMEEKVFDSFEYDEEEIKAVLEGNGIEGDFKDQPKEVQAAVKRHLGSPKLQEWVSEIDIAINPILEIGSGRNILGITGPYQGELVLSPQQ